jgi:HSP20 family molecular chaperone IbpA
MRRDRHGYRDEGSQTQRITAVANYCNGVLTMTLPKAEGSKSRRITVQG